MVLSQNSLGQRYRRSLTHVTLGTGWAYYPRLTEDGNESFAEVVVQFERNIPAAAKAAIDFAAFTARLKPCPFKTNSN
jgi:hypothetical protein